jgi:D-serine dehydratase
VEDDELYRLLALLADNEGMMIEPSSTAGFLGPGLVEKSGYLANEKKGTHIVWATGGSLVPKADMERFYEKGKELIHQVSLV